MRRENISEDEARKILVKDDDERRKWGLHLYKIDTWDPSLYDLVLHIGKITVDEAVEIITTACQKPSFQTTPESQKIFDDLLLAAQIQSLLIEQFPTVNVNARGNQVFVTCQSSLSDNKLTERITGLITSGVAHKDLEIHVSPILTPG